MVENNSHEPPSTDEPFRSQKPKREWLLRCVDPEDESRDQICGILAEAGHIVILGPEDLPVFNLHGDQIGEFREAFREAVAIAEQDERELRAERAERARQNLQRTGHNAA